MSHISTVPIRDDMSHISTVTIRDDMSHISTVTIRDDMETVMAADVTPRLHEIKTGFCNMLVKGNLPGWKPQQPLLYNRKTTHHLLRHALLSFFHPETHSPAIICPTSSASDWIHQNISANPSIFYTEGADWRKNEGSKDPQRWCGG